MLIGCQLADIQAFVSSDERFAALRDHGLATTDIAMDLPTAGKGSPSAESLPSPSETTARLRRRFGGQGGSQQSTRDSSAESGMHPPALQ